jgi:hypothetical protein
MELKRDLVTPWIATLRSAPIERSAAGQRSIFDRINAIIEKQNYCQNISARTCVPWQKLVLRVDRVGCQQTICPRTHRVLPGTRVLYYDIGVMFSH